MRKLTVQDIINKKKSKTKITALSTYDFPFAKLADESGIDIVLVGDSVGMVQLGYDSTLSVTMDEMIHHAKAAARGTKQALLVADMPYHSYETAAAALRNARRFIEEAHAGAVKLEGGEKVAKQVKALTRVGIAVMGHVGMTPQSIKELGGYKVQGKTKPEADRILKDALILQEAGVFAIVLECVPYKLAEKITKEVSVPTIGIGAGPLVNGQILVLHDLLGFHSIVNPRFVRRYADVDKISREAIGKFKTDVVAGNFPSLKESFE